MNIHQASKILNQIGIPTIVENNCLREKVKWYDNYYKLEKIGSDWVYGQFVVERQNKPYLKKKKEFHSEEEGAKYFLLKLSSSYYIDKLSKFRMKHKDLDFYENYPVFDEKKLYKAMSLLNIPSTLLVIENNVPEKNRAIRLSKVDESNLRISFIDKEGKEKFLSIPMKYQRASFFALRDVFLLHMFEQELNQLLEKEGITLSDEEIGILLGY